jgi:hypothetical protein
MTLAVGAYRTNGYVAMYIPPSAEFDQIKGGTYEYQDRTNF